MTTELVLFTVLGAVALGSAIAVVAMRDIVHAALMLVINLVAIAGLYLALESSFLSIIQVLVYAGAIVVLFLFVIMLLGVDRDDLLIARGARTRAVAITAGVLLSGALLLAFVGPYTSAASVCGAASESTAAVSCAGLADTLGEDASGVAFLGRRLFTRYTLPFELAALLLTVATIGAVILARRRDLEPEDVDHDVDVDAQGE
ncbi:MAG: NADH-quinone oxidoreductase subunit J [Nitriliruptoraceae bacterium]